MSSSPSDIKDLYVDQVDGDESFLPDFCSGRMVLTIVLVTELTAIILALASSNGSENFWTNLARLSMFMLWLGLANAGALCLAKRFVHTTKVAHVAGLTLVVVLFVTALITEATYVIGDRMFPELDLQNVFPTSHQSFLLRILGIATIVSALLLRYFYVIHQWRTNVQLEARSRISALQARIRPHFLFNSMNTIAELTRSDAVLAEQAVEDLADLFRATLADSDKKVRLKEELEMARIYQRIEQLRLGDRLQVIWNVDELPMRALVPGISLQPLIENAIYHGIERLPEGGVITVEGEFKSNNVSIMIRNPVATDNSRRASSGNQIALNNIRQRFELAYNGRATVKTSLIDNHFSVYLRFPLVE